MHWQMHTQKDSLRKTSIWVNPRSFHCTEDRNSIDGALGVQRDCFQQIIFGQILKAKMGMGRLVEPIFNLAAKRTHGKHLALESRRMCRGPRTYDSSSSKRCQRRLPCIGACDGDRCSSPAPCLGFSASATTRYAGNCCKKERQPSSPR